MIDFFEHTPRCALIPLPMSNSQKKRGNPRARGEIILHGRRLHLKRQQAHFLAKLLARPGRIVKDRELGTLSRRQIEQLRETIIPHGLFIYRVRGRGFVLLNEEAP